MVLHCAHNDIAIYTTGYAILLPRTSSAGHSSLFYAVDVDVLFPRYGHRSAHLHKARAYVYERVTYSAVLSK
ncbi:hypothetical protein M422DRAFT_26356 [Sphaerobolus stellatus SS14]|nr:hypothetical protein M422DRAFT_26356 [Sphaerobolus stellatus SS14]